MLLSQITARPERYQFRDAPFSEKTVAAIVAEGINLAKFDPIPVIPDGDGYCVGGDGHSRFEAVRRLAEQGRLPDQWLIAADEHAVETREDWDIPTRIVTPREAQMLSWTANLSRDDFSPCEEAKVFDDMLGGGMSLEQVAQAAHRSTSYIKNALALNCLCYDIRVMVGKPTDAGGIDKYSAYALAERFQRYDVQPCQQQELWHRVLTKVSLTPKFVRSLLDSIAGKATKKQEAGMLFQLPASMEHAVDQFKDRARQLRRAQLGIEYLMVCKDSGVLDDFPDLKHMVDRDGERYLNCLKKMNEKDAEVLGNLCTAA